jgi:mono/diheme cytochrome c family protein
MDFIGRLHPLFVHLPIGFLVLGLLLYWWTEFTNDKRLIPALKPIFLLGTIAAVVSIATGFFLSWQDDYDEDSLNRHRNSGIALAVLSLYFWFLITKKVEGRRPLYLSFSVMLLLVLSGHYGASLTHGSGFLFGSGPDAIRFKPLANAQEALAYKEVIDPILQQKCVSCHGADKQKGKLRLDSEAFIKKGGKNGNTVAKNADEALMLNRILLPPDDEEHMPPKEKGQLTKDQVALIDWWIRNGANFQAKVKEIQQDDQIKKTLVKLEGPGEADVETVTEVLPEVDPAPAAMVALLKKAGAVVVPVAAGSALLTVNLINLTDSTEQTWKALAAISEQVLELKAEGAKVSNATMSYLKDMKHLRRLSLVGSSINDSALTRIAALTALQSLNLRGTKVTGTGLAALAPLKNLKALYLFQTTVDSSNMAMVKTKLPGIQLEAGQYQVPILYSDTTKVAPPKKP